MKISKVTYNNSYSNPYNTRKSSVDYQPYNYKDSASINSYPKNYFLSFGAIGMNLARFNEVNKDRMPASVKEHIGSLPDTTSESPLEAHINAFSLLADSDIKTADDIKNTYRGEELFKDLKNPDDTKATRGLLYEARLMKDILDESNEGILKSKEDLTVYLIKKIFLEVKPLTEINEDLDKDINPVFKKEDKDYITYATLNSLGIHLPSHEYLTSLRTTDENYSKKIGALISNALSKLTPEQKAKMGSHSHHSKDISQDAREKMSKAQLLRWNKLSDTERTDLISKMQAGNELQKVVMTAAWNDCPQIRKDLSAFLIESNLHRPESIIYKSDEFSEYQSKIMTRFWMEHHSEDENEDYGKILGKAVKKSRQDAQNAIENNAFDKYKDSVYKKTEEIKQQIRKENKLLGRKPAKSPSEAREKLLEKYKQEYADIYSFLPKSYLDDTLRAVEKLDVAALKIMCENLKNGSSDKKSIEKLNNNKSFLTMNNSENNRNVQALQLALSDSLFESCKDNNIFAANITDLLATVRALNFMSETGTDYPIPFNGLVYEKRPSTSAINAFYEKYDEELSDEDIKKLNKGIKEILDSDPVITKMFEQQLKQAAKGQGKYLLEILNGNEKPYKRLMVFDRFLVDFPLGEKNELYLRNAFYKKINPDGVIDYDKAIEDLVKSMTETNPNMKLL